MQTNIQKGKGVAVDDGNDHDLDEVEWDEVCKIVDYAEGNGSEGNGSGDDDDDDDGVSDESDGLFDSELEGGDGEGDDSETDSNVDDCGVEDSGQEEVESSDSEDTTSDDDVCLSQDNFDSVAGSDGEEKEPHHVFNPRNKYDPHFEIGMIFSNKIELREAIHSHVIYDRGGWVSSKGSYGGVLLTAVSIYPNNNLYPLAYAVVSGETREAWQWFLELLKGDLHVVRDDVYTFISDKQKQLIPAFEYVFPGADNRFCVRHLHGNMKIAGFRGLAFKKVLWNAAKATTMSEFNYRIEELAKLDPKVVDWLSDKPPAHWSRKWDLTGIPCNHGMSAICSQSLKPDDFVNPYYSVATFIEVYKHAILPVNGPKLWGKTGFVPPLPPNFGRVQEDLQELEE
ncbi:UNVERIFIED_CONTAM: hypothetical protein Sangu_3004900 [Sesamum angustifolium]|uniref:MULE transposase domain-containing protein n=1 Tax=Sesamum angustifolium TaxID=2727405 RepID=A0AAW2KLI6_9LAMI